LLDIRQSEALSHLLVSRVGLHEQGEARRQRTGLLVDDLAEGIVSLVNRRPDTFGRVPSRPSSSPIRRAKTVDKEKESPFAGRISGEPFAGLLGIRLVEVDDGYGHLPSLPQTLFSQTVASTLGMRPFHGKLGSGCLPSWEATRLQSKRGASSRERGVIKGKGRHQEQNILTGWRSSYTIIPDHPLCTVLSESRCCRSEIHYGKGASGRVRGEGQGLRFVGTSFCTHHAAGVTGTMD